MRKERNENPRLSDVLEYLEKRFGLDRSIFAEHSFYIASKGRIYLGPKHAIGSPRIVTLGLLIARADGSIKPTTNLLQIFGRSVTRNALNLEKGQAIAYAKGEDIKVDKTQHADVSDGYVLLKYGNHPLGCGLIKSGVIKNMLPKAKRLEIKFL